MASSLIVELPWPRSLNHTWKHSGRRVYLDPKYKAWINEVGWTIKLQKYKKIGGPFNVSIILHPPITLKQKFDIDNRAKGLLDALQRFDLIDNDNLCRRLVVELGEPTTSGMARLTIESVI